MEVGESENVTIVNVIVKGAQMVPGTSYLTPPGGTEDGLLGGRRTIPTASGRATQELSRTKIPAPRHTG